MGSSKEGRALVPSIASKVRENVESTMPGIDLGSRGGLKFLGVSSFDV